MFKYRLLLTEYERGWGSTNEYCQFNTRLEAEAYREEINSKNTLESVPDYYVTASTIDIVEVVE
jgi:hypothetical protein